MSMSEAKESITLSEFKVNDQGVCKARFSVNLVDLGITIKNCAYFDTGDRRWIGLPCKEYEKDGKKKYYQLVVFEANVKRVFEDKVMKLAKAMLAAPPVFSKEEDFYVPDWVK